MDLYLKEYLRIHGLEHDDGCMGGYINWISSCHDQYRRLYHQKTDTGSKEYQDGFLSWLQRFEVVDDLRDRKPA